MICSTSRTIRILSAGSFPCSCWRHHPCPPLRHRAITGSTPSTHPLAFSSHISAIRTCWACSARLPAVSASTRRLRTISDVTLTVKTASVFTNHEKRDEHLRKEEFLWTDKYPEMTFTMTSAQKTGERTGKITGNLTLRGVTKPITLDITLNKVARISLRRRTVRQAQLRCRHFRTGQVPPQRVGRYAIPHQELT